MKWSTLVEVVAQVTEMSCQKSIHIYLYIMIGAVVIMVPKGIAYVGERLVSIYFCCQCLSSYTSQKAELRAPLSPLQTAWTGFDPYLYTCSCGSSSTGPAVVETATAKPFILIRGTVTDTMSATPLEPGW